MERKHKLTKEEVMWLRRHTSSQSAHCSNKQQQNAD